MKDETPTNSELYRLMTEVKQHQKENADMHTKWHEEDLEKHEENLEKLSSLNTKVGIANGRTGTNEKAISLLGENFSKISDKVDNLGGDRKWIIGAAATLILLQGVLVYFARLYIADVARTVVFDTLSRYDIEITK